MSSHAEASNDTPGPPGAADGALPAGAEAYGLLLDVNPDPMWIYDVDTLRFMAVNDAAMVAYGYSWQEFMAMTVADIRDPGEPLGPVPHAAGGPSRVWRHRRKDGSTIEVEIASSPLALAGRSARLILAKDVTEARALQLALHQSEERFRQVFAHAPVAQMTIGLDGRLSQVNAATCAMAGRSEAELLGIRLADLIGEGHTLDADLARVAAGDVTVFRLETTLPTVGGEPMEVELTASAVRDDDGTPLYVVGLMQDVTGRRDAHKVLAEQAMTDPLTGLPNRLLFLDRLDKALHQSNRDGGSVAVLFIDLDRFKLVNDTLGHAAGDEVLLAVTRRLRNAVTHGDTIARFGGDEFTVLCTGLADPDSAMAIARRVLGRLAAPVEVAHEQRSFSVSIGVAVAGPEDHITGDFLVQGADSAMYRAKQNGRNRCELFDQASRARTIARLRRADEMRVALEEDQLRLEYQPIVRLHGHGASDVEALVRWEHPEHGRLTPPDFLAVAEETRLIVQIGAWVIARACEDVVRLEPSGGEPIGVAVNLSASQLARGDLVDLVRAALEANHLEPRRLCLEITETVLMEDLEWSIEALLGLKALGVRLAIDDFGTGYSSLNYLRRLPVDVVKIDQSFVAGLGADPGAEAIVAAIINLSHALGLTVVAEGVERQDQLVALRALGCDQAQGFYWSPAVSFDELRLALVGDIAVMEHAPVDVRTVMRDRANALRETTGRSILLRGPERLPAALADTAALGTVLDHLLRNAVRFSGTERPVVLSASADRRWVRISVSDFGVGMTESEMTRCFEPFWHGRLRSGGQGGTGIGLYIVRSLVEKIGGQVWVRSSPGKGSTFTVALPRSAASGKRAEPVAPSSPSWERGEQTVIQEFMRQLGVPQRREA